MGQENQKINKEYSSRIVIYWKRGEDRCFSGCALSILLDGKSPTDKHPCSEHLVRYATHNSNLPLDHLINKIESSWLFNMNPSQQAEGMINYYFDRGNLPIVRKFIRKLRRGKG